MTIEEFIPAFEKALEIPPGEIKPDTDLLAVPEFDSMGRLSVMALADTGFGVVLEAERLNACKTIADLFALLQKPAA